MVLHPARFRAASCKAVLWSSVDSRAYRVNSRLLRDWHTSPLTFECLIELALNVRSESARIYLCFL
jgi:hypothetical protein